MASGLQVAAGDSLQLLHERLVCCMHLLALHMHHKTSALLKLVDSSLVTGCAGPRRLKLSYCMLLCCVVCRNEVRPEDLSPAPSLVHQVMYCSSQAGCVVKPSDASQAVHDVQGKALGAGHLARCATDSRQKQHVSARTGGCVGRYEQAVT